MKFFVDNCLPPRVARSLNELVYPDHSFVHIKDHQGLSQDATDIEWITYLGQDGGWVVLTKDSNITKRPAEKEAFKLAKLTGFFLDKSWSHLKVFQFHSKLAAHMENIIDLAEKYPKGKCFRVRVNSTKIEEI